MHILPIVTVSFTAGIVLTLPWPLLFVLAHLTLPSRVRPGRIPVRLRYQLKSQPVALATWFATAPAMTYVHTKSCASADL